MHRMFAARLRAMRQVNNWTLVDASEATGVSPAVLNRIENQKRAPVLGTLIKIAMGFNVGIEDLVDLTDYAIDSDDNLTEL